MPVLGQNGTGKTTLLDLISMVVRSDFSSLSKEEFAIEYEFSVPEGEGIIVVVRNDRVAMEQLQTPVELGAREVFRPAAEVLRSADRRRLLRYDTEHGLSVGDAPPNGLTGIPSPLDRGFLFVFTAGTHLQDFDDRIVHFLVPAGKAHRLDESLDFFRRITGSEDPLGDVIVVEPRWMSNPLAPPLVPDSIVQQLEKSYQPTKPDYSFNHGDLDPPVAGTRSWTSL